MPVAASTFNQYYSFTIGKIHYLGVNYAYNASATPEQRDAMLSWINADLAEANKERFHVPWLVVFSHYPIYCSDNCSQYYEEYQAWDKLWFNNEVDLVLQGHRNYWER
jgi:hypothetical protein